MYTQLYSISKTAGQPPSCRSSSTRRSTFKQEAQFTKLLLTLKYNHSTSVLSVVIHKAVNLQVGGPCTLSSTQFQKLLLNLCPVGRRPHMTVNLQAGS